MKNQHIRNWIDTVVDEIKKPQYTIEGFDFISDIAEDESNTIFEPLEGMPRVNGFLIKFEGVLYGEQ